MFVQATRETLATFALKMPIATLDVCVEDPPVADGSGRCACNADTQEGCDDGFFCATPEEIGLAVGELISVATFCKLPVGVPCQDSFDCLTQHL